MKKGEKMSEIQKKKIASTLFGHPTSLATRKLMGQKSKGRHPVCEFKKGQPGPRTKFKKGRIPWNKGKEFLAIKGEKNCNWKGGVSKTNYQDVRNSFEYRMWRISVFERDNYTCIWCGARCGKGKSVELCADHIKPFFLYPELRFAIDNGRTLCSECHRTTDTYGGSRLYKNNKQ